MGEGKQRSARRAMAGLLLACGLCACGAETDAPEPEPEHAPRHSAERRGTAKPPVAPEAPSPRSEEAVEGEAAEDERSVPEPPRFVASLGRLHIQGPMDKAVVRRLFRRERASLARCARKAAQAGDDPTGALELQLMLTDSHPEVKTVVVRSNRTGSKKRLTRCVGRALRSWSWPTQYVCGAAHMRLRIELRREQAQ